MDLSNEAVICLRPPSGTKLPIPQGYSDPAIEFLTRRKWCPVFSTLPASRYHRDPPHEPRFGIQILPASKSYTITESWVEVATYIDPLEVEPRKTTHSTSRSGVAETVNENTCSSFVEGDTKRHWEIICWGKQGQLESWMVDDDSGLIGDGSGEARPDWRNSYVVIYYEAIAGEGAGIEVWDSIGYGRRLTDATLEKMRDAIRATGDANFAGLADKLVEVIPSKPKEDAASENKTETKAISSRVRKYFKSLFSSRG
ncbi:hypothetical protein B0I35DRAFT_158882 [Stachybotrys elegans]|uniref:Uncharacterized protein n=1 Tax=Stachybotrys elegans TaxID=80388 RepID=A0A8K0SVR7_9HYPO|nr:hypothetical protein B0I35DRAFT_158882 [Stachybotrys elegans]